MSATPAPRSLMQELVAGHVLAMQCGGRASAFLDRAAAGPAGRDTRSDYEALRMGALFSRLVENVGRGMTLVQSSRVPTNVGAGLSLSSGRPLAGSGGPPRAALRAAPTTPAPKLHAAPDAPRGRLKNGNPSGDYLRAPRCGARTRAGCACRQPAMKNGRCRLHGGLSTGPRTAEGKRRAQTARLVHGYRTAELIDVRSRAVHAARRLRLLTTVPRSAGHGVDRSDSFFAGARCARPSRAPITASSMKPYLHDPRACAARPYSGPSRPLYAGHGVDRPDSIRRVAAPAR